MSRSSFVQRSIVSFVLFLLLAVSACDGAEVSTTDTGAPVDSGVLADSVAVSPGDANGGDAPIPLPADYVTLSGPDAEGLENGSAVSDIDGRVRLYSTVHDTLLDFTLVDDAGAAVAGVEVAASVDAAGDAFLLAWDPDERWMPLPVYMTLPEASASLTVHGRDAIEAEGPFDPTVNPFAPALLTGLSVQVAIRWTLINIGVGIAVSAVLDVANNVCRAAGGAGWACDLATEILGYVAAVAVPGVRLRALGMLTWSAIGRVAASELGNTLLDNACSRIPKALVAWTLEASADANLAAARAEYLEVASMQNHLTWRLTNDPPTDPARRAELEQLAEESARLLAVLNRMVRPDWVEAYDTREAPGALDGVLGNSALKLAVDLGKSLYRTSSTGTGTWNSPRFSVELNDRIRRLLRAESRIAEWNLEVGTPASVANSPGRATALGCVVTLVKGVGLTLVEGGPAETISTTETIRALTEVAREALTTGWNRAYGTDLPPPGCVVDFFEPNGSWEAVSSRPVSSVGDGLLDELTLCGPDGSGAEEDWYAFTMPFLTLNLDANLVGVPGGRGQDDRVCLELSYWDQALDFVSEPPTSIAGPVCATVRDGISIPRIAVSRTLGVEWSQIYAHVTLEPGSTSASGIDYQLDLSL